MEESKNISSQRTDKYSVITGKVKIVDLHDFKGHPFKVEHDIKLFELSISIEENGVLVPLIVRKDEVGGYEKAGKRNDLFVSQVGMKLKKNEMENKSPALRADERFSKEVGESRNQIARYIRLTNLIPKMLDIVDDGKIAFTIAVELSYERT